MALRGSPGGAKGSSSMDPVMAEIGPVRLWYYGLAHAVGLLVVDLRVWR